MFSFVICPFVLFRRLVVVVRFSSPGVLYSVKLAQSARATAHLGASNPLHTLVVCALLAHFVQSPSAFPAGGGGGQRAAAQALMEDVFRLVFDDYDETRERLQRIDEV